MGKFQGDQIPFHHLLLFATFKNANIFFFYNGVIIGSPILAATEKPGPSTASSIFWILSPVLRF